MWSYPLTFQFRLSTLVKLHTKSPSTWQRFLFCYCIIEFLNTVYFALSYCDWPIWLAYLQSAQHLPPSFNACLWHVTGIVVSLDAVSIKPPSGMFMPDAASRPILWSWWRQCRLSAGWSCLGIGESGSISSLVWVHCSSLSSSLYNFSSSQRWFRLTACA